MSRRDLVSFHLSMAAKIFRSIARRFVGDNFNTLFEGQKVEYAVLHRDDKGPAATHVILCDK